MRLMVHFIGLWVARDIAEGRYPKPLALPLGVLIARLRTPPLAIALFSFVLFEMQRARRLANARDVTPGTGR